MVLDASSVRARIEASATGSFHGGFFDLNFQAMGTRCRVLFSAPNVAEGRRFGADVIFWAAQFEARYSRFLGTSLISQINDAAGRRWVEIDPETEQLLNLCHELHFLTRGALDPTALPLLRLWDWRRGIVPSPDQVASALRLVGWRKVLRQPGKVFLPQPGMALDLGGIGKEYAADRVAEMAIARGIRSVLVDFGQDIRVHGPAAGRRPFWHVGLEDPAQPGRCWAGLGLAAGAVATSGDYVRQFTAGDRRFGHIVDPRSGEPVANGCLAVSVTAPHCTVAGALSTAAFILGPKEGLRLIEAAWNAEGCIVTESGRLPSRRFYEYVATEPNRAVVQPAA